MARPSPTTVRVDSSIGPRRPGGVYLNGYSGERYTVEAITRDPDEVARLLYSGGDWAITIKPLDGDRAGITRPHCTPWNPRRDTVISQPEAG
jgi:hypothetical protein